MSFLKKPFGYEPLLTKADLKSVGPTKKKGPRASDWKDTLQRLWRIVDEQRWLLIVVLSMVVVTSALSLLGPFLVGRIIDQYIVPSKVTGLMPMLLLLVAVYIFLAFTMYLQNFWMIGIAQQTIYRLRTSVFAHLQGLPLAFFDKRQHGELMSRVTNDIESVSATLNSSFIQVFSSVLTLIGTVSIMLYLSPILTLLTMTIIPIMFIAMRWITKRTGKLYKEQQAALGSLNGMIEEIVSGQRIVKAFSQEAKVTEEFRQKSMRLRRAGFWAMSYSGYIPKVMNFLNNMSFAIVAGIGGLLALKGYVTIGVIVIFTEYARQFTRPLNDLANQFNTVLSAIAGAERVFAIMDEAQEPDQGDKSFNHIYKGEIIFNDVSFKYEVADELHTLKNVSFHIKAGQTAALIGPTGAGKTTIMQLMARFYDVTSGEILLDGIDVRKMKRQTLRGQMAFVLQDSFLFETSIRDNIRYGRLQATDEEIEAAARKANAHDFIMRLPNGYDTVLTAEGGGISQGQKQLLSIARAFVADPTILLLDEATSSIDTVTELKIQEALETLMKNRTSIVIAHRLNTVKNADVVLVLKDGRLVEVGSQQKLIADGGVYADMLQHSGVQ